VQILRLLRLILLFVICGAALIASLCVITFVYLIASVDADEYHSKEVSEHYDNKAVKWGIFCLDYDCDKVPSGMVFDMVGDVSYAFPLNNTPLEAGSCRVASPGTQYADYVDRVMQRAADNDPAGIEISVQCSYDDVTLGRWKSGEIHVPEGYLWFKEPSLNAVHKRFLPQPWKWEERPTYASRDGLLRPATSDFRVFASDHDSRHRVYLSTDRLFQGRHVVLVCGNDCKIISYSFKEDEHLTGPYLDQGYISFHNVGRQCDLFEPQWSCNPDWLEQQRSIADLVRFMDKEVNMARDRRVDMER
jgi:hypothetical protein